MTFIRALTTAIIKCHSSAVLITHKIDGVCNIDFVIFYKKIFDLITGVSCKTPQMNPSTSSIPPPEFKNSALTKYEKGK